MGEKVCPRCDAALWYIGYMNRPVFFVRNSGATATECLVDLLSPHLEETLVEELGLDGTTSTSDIRKMLDQMDSLDMVELLLELEPFLQRHISDDDLALGPPDTFA